MIILQNYTYITICKPVSLQMTCSVIQSLQMMVVEWVTFDLPQPHTVYYKKLN